MDPLVWLTPAEIRRPPFPRWTGVPAALALLVCVVGKAGGLDTVLTVGKAMAVLAAPPLAWWFEERIFGWLGNKSAAVKVWVLAGLSLAMGCVGAAIVGILYTLLPFGLGQFASAYGSTFLWWTAAAAAGSLVVVVIDASVSAWRARFPTRLMLAILLLIGAALCLAMFASIVASGLAVALAKGSGNIRFDPGFEWLHDRLLDSPGLLSLFIFFIVFLAATPAVLSACAKLADAAMERLRPMAKAFALVSEGQRTVRVEEKGSTEFIELSQSFNKLVETLDATERMEKAFGRYVSGQVLAKIKAQHGEAELKASSRTATVFFADIRGFTQLSEKLKPEQVVEFLNRYLARVVAQVDAHEGYLNKFIGDAVVVVFNGPVDQADHAERAVKCALALQVEVARINAEGVLPEIGALRIGVGIATGPMVCGNVGGPTQMEYTVIGDTVNLSARLTSLASPGEVWVSEATAQAAPQFRYTVLPEVKLKGKEKPVAPLRAEGAA